ncbi:MAG: DUF819 family protein [Acidobacteriota bacterium]
MIEQPLALIAAIVAVTALGFWLEDKFIWARHISGSLLIIFFGALLSNLELVPLASPVYDAIWGPVTSLAIVWLLFGVRLADLRAAGPRMLFAFGLAVIATSLGAFAAALVFGGSFPEDAWRLGGVMTGTYAGGSLNFVAVGREVDLSGTLFTAAAASDNVLTALWMGATLLLPLWLRRFYPARSQTAATGDGKEQPTSFLGTWNATPFDVLALLTLGLGLILASDAITAQWPAVPSVIWLTSLALVVGQIPAVRRLSGSMHMGLIALNLFFVVIGIASRISEILRVGIEVFYFTAMVILVHGVIVYLGGRLMRLDVETLSVASQAAVGGPSTAMALATARGWRELALPGIAVGLLGYAVGTYAGIAVASVLRSMLG